MLALAVLGGTYATTPGPISPTSVPKFVTYNLGYYPDLNATHPALAAFIASPTGDHLSGINVQLVKETGQRFGPTGTRFQLLQTNSTDSSGWVRFNKLWTSYPNSSLGLVYPDLKGSYFCCVSTAAAISPPYKNTGDAMWHVLSLGDSSKKTLSLVFTDTMGQPLSSADVLVWRVPNATSLQGPYDKQSPPDGWTTKHKIGTTDSSGFFINPQPYDNWLYLPLWVLRYDHPDLWSGYWPCLRRRALCSNHSADSIVGVGLRCNFEREERGDSRSSTVEACEQTWSGPWKNPWSRRIRTGSIADCSFQFGRSGMGYSGGGALWVVGIWTSRVRGLPCPRVFVALSRSFFAQSQPRISATHLCLAFSNVRLFLEPHNHPDC